MLRIDWDQHKNLVLRDIDERWFPRVVEYMRDNLLNKNPLYHKLNYFEDENLYRDYEQLLIHCLKSESSIVAVTDDPKEEIHAAAILKWNEATIPMWRTLSVLLEEGKINQLVQLHCRTIFEHYQTNKTTHSPTENSVHIFQYFIREELKTPEFMSKFFGAITEVARHMKSKRITFLGMQNKERHEITSMGYKKVKSVVYSLYKHNGTHPFDPLRDMDEMTAKLFEKPVEELIPYEDLPPFIDTSHPKENAPGRSSSRA